MLTKLRQFFGIPEYYPGTILSPNKEFPDNHMWLIVLARPNKFTIYNKNSNNIYVAEYPIKDINCSGMYSYNSLRRYYNTTGMNKTLAVLYGKKHT